MDQRVVLEQLLERELHLVRARLRDARLRAQVRLAVCVGAQARAAVRRLEVEQVLDGARRRDDAVHDLERLLVEARARPALVPVRAQAQLHEDRLGLLHARRELQGALHQLFEALGVDAADAGRPDGLCERAVSGSERARAI